MEILESMAAFALLLVVLNIIPYYLGRHIVLAGLKRYRSLSVPESGKIESYHDWFTSDQQAIEFSGSRLRLVDWDGVTSPLPAKGIGCVRFYRRRSSKGRHEWYPRVTLYRRDGAKRFASLQDQHCDYGLHGHDTRRGCDGVQLINNMHLTVKDYVLLRKYCQENHIPVQDDYARDWKLPLCG